MKEDFFSKFKDYNKELEKILDHKEFSQEAKNLLLSMFYKLEASYQDYSIVKRHCFTKQEYLQKILENIKYINSIQVISKESLNTEKTNKTNLYDTDFRFKIIKVIGNEYAILSAVLCLNNFEVHVDEKYRLIKNSMSHLLNTAYEMENIEPIRDFNAWSWNTAVEQIKDIKTNLIYQNLRILLSRDIFTEVEEKNLDIIKLIEQNLTSLYGKEIAEKVLELIFKISIIIYIKVNQDEVKRLLEYKEKLELVLNKMSDSEKYFESINTEKQKQTELLKKIDLILNDKELLLKEYENRNKQAVAYNKIFNLSHFVEMLQEEKAKALRKIEVYNKKSDSKNYLEEKNNLEKEYNIIKDINIDGDNDVYKNINELQLIFIKHMFPEKIKAASTRKEIIDIMYELRYYNFLSYTNEKQIKDIEQLKKHIEDVEGILINKLYENNYINHISANQEKDIEIIKNIFDLKIINMESIYIQIHKNQDKYILSFYDGKETLDTQYEMNLEINKKDRIKLNKKIKLFKHE